MKKFNMIILSILFVVFVPLNSIAEVHGYVFFGQYVGNRVGGLEGRGISYRAGLYLETVKKDFTFFLKEETLIKGWGDASANPIQIGYTLGVKLDIRGTDVIYKHVCNHPIDGIGGGDNAIAYDIVEARFNF